MLFTQQMMLCNVSCISSSPKRVGQFLVFNPTPYPTFGTESWKLIDPLILGLYLLLNMDPFSNPVPRRASSSIPIRSQDSFYFYYYHQTYNFYFPQSTKKLNMQPSPLKTRLTDIYLIKLIFIKLSQQWCNKIVKKWMGQLSLFLGLDLIQIQSPSFSTTCTHTVQPRRAHRPPVQSLGN